MTGDGCLDEKEVAAAAMATSGASSSTSWSSQLIKERVPKPGAIIDGKYLVDRTLGRGGMGVVLLATHVELGHRVALKVSFQDDEIMRMRFLREAKVVASIDDEHVAKVSDVGTLADGTPYLVMEYLDGEDLSAVLKRGPVSEAQAITWIVQACAGLAAAHRRGVVHRDVKPHNLFLAKKRDGGTSIKVLDFGVSKLTSRELEQIDLDLTTTSQVIGSPAYMSIEQLRNAKDVDARADVWSLGVVLFQLVTGRHPFPSSTFSEFVIAVVGGTAPAPSSVTRGISARFDACVARCLEKEREARFASVDELAAALLGRTAVGRASSAVPDRARVPAMLWVGAGGALLALIAAIAFALTRPPSSTQPVTAGSATTSAASLVTSATASTPIDPAISAPQPSTSVPIRPTAAVPSQKPSASASGKPVIKPLGPTDTPE
ncbi:hypothetical protein BH09MYX1_BH09MYX1_01830 [soil metagenome]